MFNVQNSHDYSYMDYLDQWTKPMIILLDSQNTHYYFQSIIFLSIQKICIQLCTQLFSIDRSINRENNAYNYSTWIFYIASPLW